MNKSSISKVMQSNAVKRQRSMNLTTRKKEVMRIDEENKKLVLKLQRVQSQLSQCGLGALDKRSNSCKSQISTRSLMNRTFMRSSNYPMLDKTMPINQSIVEEAKAMTNETDKLRSKTPNLGVEVRRKSQQFRLYPIIMSRNSMN